MNVEGKLENVKKEMKRNGLNVLGMSEVRWKECGDFESKGYRVVYSGGMVKERGVAIVLDYETAKRVVEVEQYSDRVLMVKLQTEPVDIVLEQVYMPTSDHDDEEIETMYEQLDDIIGKQKGTEYMVIMGDLNAVEGEGRGEIAVGKFGLGKRNARGERLVEFCKTNKLMITNTWFEQEKRRRYTWKMCYGNSPYYSEQLLSDNFY